MPLGKAVMFFYIHFQIFLCWSLTVPGHTTYPLGHDLGTGGGSICDRTKWIYLKATTCTITGQVPS